MFLVLFLSCVSFRLPQSIVGFAGLSLVDTKTRIASNLIMRDEPTIHTHLFITYIFTHKFDSFHFRLFGIHWRWFRLFFLFHFFFRVNCYLLHQSEEEKHEGNNAFRYDFFFFGFISFDFNFLHPNSGNIRHNKFDWIINDVMGAHQAKKKPLLSNAYDYTFSLN